MNILTQIDDYSLVQFHSLDVSEEDTIGDLLMYINTTIQYGEGWVHTPTLTPLQDDSAETSSLTLYNGSLGMRLLPRPLWSHLGTPFLCMMGV